MSNKIRGIWCAAYGCNNACMKKAGLSFFTFPKDPVRYVLFVTAVLITVLLLSVIISYVNFAAGLRM